MVISTCFHLYCFYSISYCLHEKNPSIKKSFLQHRSNAKTGLLEQLIPSSIRLLFKALYVYFVFPKHDEALEHLYYLHKSYLASSTFNPGEKAKSGLQDRCGKSSGPNTCTVFDDVGGYYYFDAYLQSSGEAAANRPSQCTAGHISLLEVITN